MDNPQPSTRGNFHFPGINAFIDRAAADVGENPAAPTALADGARRSTNLGRIAHAISGAASTHDATAVGSILGQCRAVIAAMDVERRAAELAVAHAYQAAKLDMPDWAGGGKAPAPAPTPTPETPKPTLKLSDAPAGGEKPRGGQK